jgi:hypothetical protein
MRLLRSLSVLLVTAAATIAVAMPDTAAERARKSATAHLEKGRELLADVAKLDTNAARLQSLDRALYFLRRSRTLLTGREGEAFDSLRADVSRDLVRALLDQAEIYYVRKSLSLAQKRAKEALAIDSEERRALELTKRIDTAKNTDIYEGKGTVAIQRIRERRAAAGLPLRDRGISTRR